jgi:hypothetical protein
MVQHRAARYTCNRYHNTISVTQMLQTLNWLTLEKRRIRTRIIFHYKTIYPTHLVTHTDSRTRQYSHSYSYRLIQTTKDSYKYLYYPRTIFSTMEPPTGSCSTMHYSRQFPRADPNICSRSTLQYLNTTLVYSFNLKCIIYKSKRKRK